MRQLLREIMSQGVHRHLFCYTQHCLVGYYGLKHEYEDCMKEWEEGTAEHNSGKQVFVADPFCLQYT